MIYNWVNYRELQLYDISSLPRKSMIDPLSDFPLRIAPSFSAEVSSQVVDSDFITPEPIRKLLCIRRLPQKTMFYSKSKYTYFPWNDFIVSFTSLAIGISLDWVIPAHRFACAEIRFLFSVPSLLHWSCLQYDIVNPWNSFRSELQKRFRPVSVCRNRCADTTLDFKFVQPFAKLQHLVYFRQILL